MNTIPKHDLTSPVRWNALLAILPLAVGMATAGFGLLTLSAWLFDWPLLASFGAGHIPMAPSTALLFLFYGAAVCLRARGWSSRSARWLGVSMVGSGMVVALTLLVLSWLGIHWAGEHLCMSITDEIAGGAPIGHMSRVTAFCFLLAGGSFLASLSPAITRWRAVLALIAAGMLLGVVYVFLLSYVFGAPLLYGSAFIPPALNTILAFITLGVALVAVIPGLSQLQWGVSSGDNSSPFFGFLLIFAVLTLSILAGGYAYYRNLEQKYREEVHHQLAAIADLKVSELSQYRKERLADAGFLHNNPAVTRLVRLFLDSPADVDAQKQLEKLLGKYQASYDYDKVRLLDVHGVTRLSVPAGSHQPVSRVIAASAATSLRTGETVFQDFYRSENDPKDYLALLVPVFDELVGRRPLGVLFLRIDPDIYLYPFISRWPAPSKTAETLLIRREGEEVVYLNELRFKTNAALSLRIPLTRTDNPAVQAALGHEGSVEGIDYRGNPVLAEVRAVPDSPWFLVARRDSAEILTPLQQILWQVIVMVGTLLFGAGTGVVLVFRQQRLSFYRTRAEIGESLLQSEALRNEAEKLGRVGAWTIDIATRQLTWTDTVYDIHEVDRTVLPTVEEAVNFYTPESRPIIEQAVQRAIERGEPFDVELEIITAKGNRRNVHAIGKADQARRKVTGFFQDITERKAAETAIISTKTFLDIVIDMSPFAMWISDKAGTVIRTNRSLRETINLADEKIIGTYNVLEDKNLEIQGVMPQVRAVFEKHEPARFSIPWKAVSAGEVDFRGGRDMYIDVSMFPIQNEQNELTNVVCQWIDITERKRAEEKAKAMQAETERLLAAAEQSHAVLLSVVEDQQRTEEARQKFFLLAESSSEFIGMCDLELQPLYVNPAGQRMVGLSDMEAACRVKVPDYFFPEDRDFIANEFFPRVLREGHGDVEIRLRHFQTGEPLWFYYYLFSVKDATGKLIGWATVSHDITERRKAEAEIRQLNAELEQRVLDRTAQLEAANKELEAFSYSVSHDLRAPLRHIIGYADLLKKRFYESLTEKGKHYLDSISDSISQMGALIDDLLEFSRTGRQELKCDNVDMDKICKDALSAVQAGLGERDIDWAIAPLSQVYGDSTLLYLVWINLINNAVKYTKTRKKAKIQIGMREEADELVFFIKDNGVGFDMRYAQKLFGVFQRLHSIDIFEGTGIGLANVRRIINRHGGRTWAEAELNKGATFYFSLPKKDNTVGV